MTFILSDLFLTIVTEVPYSIAVKAINLAGCGVEKQITCFTQEGGTSSYYFLATILCVCNVHSVIHLIYMYTLLTPY